MAGRKQGMTVFFAVLVFTLAACIFGPYQLSGVSAAVAVALLAGVALDPLPGTLSVGLYLLVGLWLPVYAGGGYGLATLCGDYGGYLFALLPCTLAVSALRYSLRKNALLATFIGLCAAFFLYFGIGILWYVFKTGAAVGSLFNSSLSYACLRFGLDALLAFCVSPTLYRAAH